MKIKLPQESRSGFEYWSDFSEGPEMATILSGRFLMGSQAQEQTYDPRGLETPLHPVTIHKPFAIGRYAVTVGQFCAFIDDTGYSMPNRLMTGDDNEWRERSGRSFRNPGFKQSPSHPVIGVCWNDAQAYVKWLSETTGCAYRLPSESEWEFAARAGIKTPFWWGSTINPDQANYDGNYVYDNGTKGIYRQGTVEVDCFEPNPWGLSQVHGNTWEWCEDCWNSNYVGAPSDGRAWLIGDLSLRVLRGGSWLNGPWVLRAASRIGDPITFRHNSFGFRVARSLT